MLVFLCLSLLAVLGQTATEGFVHMELTKVKTSSNLVRRQDTNGPQPVYAPILQNTNKLEYIINVTIGTPPQTIGVTIDTGSSDLWVPGARRCKRSQCDFGEFEPSLSSSYELLDQGGFNITYAAPGDFDAGDWVSESVSVSGSKSITQQIVGVANTGYDSHGVMGIGFDSNEAEPNPSANGTYQSVLDNMVSQGVIARKAFSMYLNSLNQSSGSVIFGGVDTTKYSGDLIALPLQSSTGTTVSEFYVTLSEVSFTDASGTTTVLTPSGFAQSVLLDTGTSDTILPADVTTRLTSGFGAVDIGEGSYVVPCSYASSNATVNYQFGGADGPIIPVPVSELVAGQDSTECDLGFGAPLDGLVILGDTFLRSAYLVLDLDTNMAALAPAVNNQALTSNIIAIPTGTSIPGVTVTATLAGTQLAGDAATSSPAVPTASYHGHHSSIIPGTPTFNLGASATSDVTSNMAPTATTIPQAALLGAGLLAAAFL